MKCYLYNTILNQRTLHNRLVKEKEISYDAECSLTSPEKVHKFMTEVFQLNKMAEEYVFMIALNTKGKPIGFFEISHGLVNASLISPREIFIRALLVGATSVIITHNHPSLDCSPSAEDLKITKKIKEAGDIIGIKLLDHIIIGQLYCSLNEMGVIQ